MHRSICFFLLACGQISVGGSTTTNNARPTGAPVTQAAILGQNGQTVTGIAYVFFVSNQGYIVRLEGLSVTNESNLVVKIYSRTGILLTSLGLKSFTGNQNYSVSSTTGGTQIGSVTIYSNLKSINYAQASFPQSASQPTLRNL